MKPTEDAMQNDEAERKLVRFADGIIPPGTVIGSFVADEHDDKAIIAEVITPAPEAAALIRTQAARIAEMEAHIARWSSIEGEVTRKAHARAEAAEATADDLRAENERLREALFAADWALMEMYGCFPLGHSSKRQAQLHAACLLVREHTGKDYAKRNETGLRVIDAALQPKQEDV